MMCRKWNDPCYCVNYEIKYKQNRTSKMKKIIYSIAVLAMAAMTFTGCESIPAPYDLDYTDPNEGVDLGTPEGEGTVASPYNIARVLEILNNGEQTTNAVYVKGLVNSTQDFDVNYGNMTYLLVDEMGSKNTLMVYRGKYYNAQKFTSADQLQEGDTVVVSGVITLYNATPEMNAGSSIISINGKTDGSSTGGETTGTPSGTGTQADPYNVTAVLQLAQGLGSGEKSDPVYFKGKISSIKEVETTNYGNASYYISEDGTTTGDQFYVYHSFYLNNEKFTSTDQIHVGDDVVIYGTVTNYMGNTPETTGGDSYLVSITNNGGSTVGEGEVSTADADVVYTPSTDYGYEEKQPITTVATLGDGTTVTITQNDGYTAPAYYPGEARIYAKNVITLSSSKKIEKVIINCASPASGKNYNGNDEAYATDGTHKVTVEKNSDTQVQFTGLDGKKVDIVNDYSGTSGGTQLRIKSMAIYYAD